MATWRFFRPVDSRGRESRTLFFVAASWGMVTLKFAVDAFGHLFGSAPVFPMSATEYAAVSAALIGVWLGREWVDAKRNGGSAMHF